MKFYLCFYTLCVNIFINIFLIMASIYLSIYGINYSINYLEIEVKNYLNAYIEKNRYFINYSKNKQYLDLIYADLYNSQIKSIENDLNYNNFKNWNSFLEFSNIKTLSNSTNLYNTILNFIMLPTKFLKYNDPSIFENNDFLVSYSKNSFKKIKSYYNKNSIINKNYWYQSNSENNYYKYLYDSIDSFLSFLEQLMLKQLNEDDIVFFNEKITIVDVNDIQNRKENLSKYSFYKVEFKKYILNSYINVIFLIIVLPINSFFEILLFLILKIYIPKIKFHPKFKFKFINSFKYH